VVSGRPPAYAAALAAQQGDEMILDVLAACEMAFSAARLIGDSPPTYPSARQSGSARHFGADHLDAGMALAVDAAPQALGAKTVIVISPATIFRIGAEKAMSARR